MGSATRRRVFSVGFLAVLCSSSLFGRSPEPLQRISVRVYDFAGVPDRTLRGAGKELARIFGPLEVGVDWVLCFQKGKVVDAICHLPSRPSELHLNLVERVPKKISGWQISPNGCGFAVLTGDALQNRRATVFQECIQRTASQMQLSAGVVLGHVVAHEVAHLLLNTNEHSTEGLLRARLGPEDWLQASYGRLEFTAEDSVRLRAAVAYRLRPPDAVQLARHMDPAVRLASAQ